MKVVDEHDVEARAFNHLDGFSAVSSYLHIDPLGAENTGAAFAKRPVIVDDQGSHFFGSEII